MLSGAKHPALRRQEGFPSFATAIASLATTSCIIRKGETAVRRRFLVEAFENGTAVVRGEEAHHLRNVLRAKPGQLYELSDGRMAWLAKVSRVEHGRVEFALVERVAARKSPVDVTVLLSIFRYARFEWALEKATELGAGVVQTMAAARSEPRLVETAGKRLARWEKIAHEATEQSRRLRPPRVLPPLPSRDAFRECKAELKLLLSERRGVPAIDRFRPAARPASVALAFGPEGGWTDEELAAAASAGFQEASLGPLILRAETAIIAGLSVVLCAWVAA